MTEISIFLKDVRKMSAQEFSALDRYSSQGRTWFIISNKEYMTIRYRQIEHIFEQENYILFRLASANILTYWFTDNTRNLKIGDSYQLDYNLHIRLHSYGF